MENLHNHKFEETHSKAVANESNAAESGTEKIAPPTFQLKLKGLPDKEAAQGKEEKVSQLKYTGGIFPNSEDDGDDQPGQLKSKSSDNTSQAFQLQEKSNNTGLPDNLKSGVENMSGFSMDDVKVHYNSNKPAQLNAHAYAQGTDIHVASGQEKHLPHEAWHVVQQKQGRVQPTKQMKGKTPINDDAGLEKEADVMGAKALKTSQSEAFQLKLSTPNIQTAQLFNFGRKGASKAKEKPGDNKLGDFMEDGRTSAINDANSITNNATFGLINQLPKDDLTKDNPHNAAATDTTPAGKNVDNATQAYNITGTLGASFGILQGIASGIDAFRNGGSVSDKINAIFDIAANTSGLVSGITGIISDHTSGGVKDNASTASNGAWIGDNAINVVKGAYNTGKEIYYAFKRHNDADTGVASDNNEKLDRSITILKGLLSTGADAVKMVNNALNAFTGSSALSEGIPILGLITSSFDIITRIIDIIRAGINKYHIRQKMIDLYNAAHPGENRTKKDQRTKKKHIFSSKEEQKHNKKINAKRALIQDASDSSEEGISTQPWEAYQYLKEMEYINGKRQIRASIKIAADLTNIGGEIATMSGVGATVGVPMKVVAATSGLAMSGFRKLKQWGRNKAEKAGDESKWKKVFDDSKSDKQKKQKIVNDIGFVFRNFSELKQIFDKPVNDQYTEDNKKDEVSAKNSDITMYVEATGASYSHFLRKYRTGKSSGGLDKAVEHAAGYLIAEMKKRE